MCCYLQFIGILYPSVYHVISAYQCSHQQYFKRTTVLCLGRRLSKHKRQDKQEILGGMAPWLGVWSQCRIRGKFGATFPTQRPWHPNE